MRAFAILCTLLALVSGPAASAERVEVVTTLPVYASVAQLVGGDRVTARSIARGDEDAHFIKPKPSFALMLRDADLLVTTGLDLELWAPILVDKSGNRKIREGEPGYVSASAGVRLLDVPESVDRSGGDVHIYGNPHVFTSPLEIKIVAANIAEGLARVDPDGEAAYRTGLADFTRRLDESLYGRDLVELLGSDVLDPLARSGKLIPFLESQETEGVKLIELLGGWLGRGLAFRDRKIVAYHKNWIYLTELFGLDVVGYVEPKPGIPPSARHVHDLIDLLRRENVDVMLSASYFGKTRIETIAGRAGCEPVIVPLGPMESGPGDYFELMDLWVGELDAALSG